MKTREISFSDFENGAASTFCSDPAEKSCIVCYCTALIVPFPISYGIQFLETSKMNANTRLATSQPYRIRYGINLGRGILRI